MRGSSSIMWSSARSEARWKPRFPLPIDIRPLKSARRLRLRFDEAAGVLKLTCPLRTSRRAALAWALDQREWIDAQLARAEPARAVRGRRLHSPRGGARRGSFGRSACRATPALVSGELRCGGPEAAIARRVERFLKRRALRDPVGRRRANMPPLPVRRRARSRSATPARAGGAARRKAGSGCAGA